MIISGLPPVFEKKLAEKAEFLNENWRNSEKKIMFTKNVDTSDFRRVIWENFEKVHSI